MEICNSCAVTMSATEVVCGGFCKSTFHYKCVHISETAYKDICCNPSAFWFCKSCCEIMKNSRFKNAMVSSNAASLELKDAYQKLVEDLKTEIKDSLLAELKQEIQGGFNKLSPALLSPAPPRFQFRNRLSSKRTHDDDASQSSDQPTKIFCGTDQSASTVSAGVSASPDDNFWVYLTKISPEVTESDVQHLAMERLQTDKAVAKSLVPKGRLVSSLTFVSFKVGVPKDLKAKAMDPATWPQGIQFREFIDYDSNSRHFWKPTQRFDPGTASASNLMQPQITQQIST